MAFRLADTPDQHGRTFVVTGANGGLGEVVTRTLAANGASVVMACRNTAKAQQIADGIDGDVTVAALDLGSLASVRDFAAQQGGFDVLVNNAGVMNIPMRRTVDGFEMQFGVNHLGHFALTGLLLDRIGDRVVTVSSIAHKQTPKFWIDDLNYSDRFYQRNLAYAQSKLANLMFARELQRRLRAAGSPLRSYAVHPGVSATELFDNDKSLPGLVAKYGMTLVGQAPERAAESIVFAATTADADPDTYWGPTKLNQARGPVGPCPSNKLSKDQRLWRRLWEESEKMTGVHYPL
ncbi:putative short-chain dehydrogenase/reductase [Mycolicibacter terrae]|uniref:Short-chain dehydrogenase/reductase n=1 Tax=Mycolicibacter terrae TaxID=1788 RepID=A0AAD1MJK1_9MYCO|nr:oxidoreductase [Mycolicibacter terrae]ORW96045.1 short-chain dehydrogenase [Mycolicibacter terrae]BBX24059.1 putative short-chain dehydrogenase/reductase [Mycolicibacter terrae]SNV56860.1 dehydrogenase/reductase [Mycolicibacter terrae]